MEGITLINTQGNTNNTQDVGYYALDGSNMSKLCVPCTFDFLISATTLPTNSPPQGYPLVGVAVKH
jgi:hypothetical protein